LQSGRIENVGAEGAYRARTLIVPLGSAVGWEAAIFDHFKALVSTVICRLGAARSSAELADRVGGSTYTLDVWPGHPHEQEAYETLRELRLRVGDLRQKVEQHNAENSVPDNYTQVLLYLGQSLIPQGGGGSDEQA
jgi:hypothetical protein